MLKKRSSQIFKDNICIYIIFMSYKIELVAIQNHWLSCTYDVCVHVVYKETSFDYMLTSILTFLTSPPAYCIHNCMLFCNLMKNYVLFIHFNAHNCDIWMDIVPKCIHR